MPLRPRQCTLETPTSSRYPASASLAHPFRPKATQKSSHPSLVYTSRSLFTALHDCMQRGLAMRELSVRLSVRLLNACIVTKRKKDLSRFLHHTKDHLAQFSEKKYGWSGRPLLPEILGQPALVGSKSPIFSRYSLPAP